jgi:ATP phosphoribosyltransferase regulatory subunit
LLPDGIEELLPEQAARLEQLRRELLDLYRGWGYQLIIPPFVEYLESLLTGTGHDLDLSTFKLIDQMSGRLMGLRADMTPQAARIDAHRLQGDAPRRLCYLGTVLHTLPTGFSGSRSHMQVGAELFGHSGADSDVEVLALMLETLRLTGVQDMHVDLGHVGIFRGLARDANLETEQESELFDAVQRKAVPEIESLLAGLDVSTAKRERMAALAGLAGGEEVLDEARARLSGAGDAVDDALDNLAEIAGGAKRRLDGVPIYFDLAELRGYRFHTGVVFAAFVADHGEEIARGGRYDSIGKYFGRARPATGFSTDLRTLMALSARRWPASPGSILAPGGDDAALVEKIAALRAAGEVVVHELGAQKGTPGDMGCDRRLVRNGAEWALENIDS